MLVVFPPSIRHDDGITPSYYEDHLLERVTLLEIRLSQVAERLALALDLMLQQTKNSHSDHLLLETLIDSLNTLGAVEKDRLRHKWQKKIQKEGSGEKPDPREKIHRRICENQETQNPELFRHLIREGINLAAQREEKQAIRTFERAFELSPRNVPLLLLIAELLLEADKSEEAKSYLENAFVLEPGNEKVRIALGLVLADGLALERAKEMLTSSGSAGTTGLLAGYVRGFIAAYESDWRSAADFFKETLAAAVLPETNYLLGCIYFELGKLKTALRYLQQAVEADTNFADAWFMLAVAYRVVGDETKAYQSLELAWSSKEPGAECLRFMKRGKQIEVSSALPFIRLKDLQKHLIMSNSRRFTNIIRREISRLLGT